MLQGPSATAAQVYNAMCTDIVGGHTTNPIESNAEQLVSQYNGWTFSNESEIADFVGENCPSTTTTTSLPPPPPTTAVTTGYFSREQVESYLSGLADLTQGNILDWSNGQATTDDGVCSFILTNSEGESQGLVDSVAISCGPPGISDSFTKSDVDEATGYLLGIVQQISGSTATKWLTQQVANAGSGGISADKEFGPVAVELNFGANQLSETLLWQG
jgi:hypothetical protein